MYIYGLYTNMDNDIRYVGKTNNLEKRLYEHLSDTIRNCKTYKHNWIRKELKKGNQIKIKILEKCNNNDWIEKEKYWIKKLPNLTNHTGGGDGGHGLLYTISYEDAKKIAHRLNIKSGNDWEKNHKNIKNKYNLPFNPNITFKNNGWISWGDFLGTNKIQDNKIVEKYISYNEAKNYIKNYIIANTIEEWKMKLKNNEIPETIPNRPDRFYANKNRGWVSWGDFLGTNRLAHKNKNFVSYEEAKKLIKPLNIKSRSEWRKYNKKVIENLNIPLTPSSTYKNNGWISMGDFLGTNKVRDNKIAENYISYEESKKYIKEKINIKSKKEWMLNAKNNKIPEIIPNHPENYYNKKDRGWKGWKDFLNKNN